MPNPLLSAVRVSVRAETDYLFVKQVPASILPADGWAQAFPYGCAPIPTHLSRLASDRRRLYALVSVTTTISTSPPALR